MEKGKLVEFRVNGEHRLAVVDRPEGKKDWMVIDSEGHSYKLRPQRVDYEVPGGPYNSDDIPQFLQEIQPYLDPSSLEVAWELLVEDGEAVTPADMASFLYSEQTPQFCYAAHRLLSEDKIYFKKKGDNYEPRSASQVEEIKHQLEVQQQRQQEKEIFFEHIQQAMAGEGVEWTQSDRTRLESLEKFVLQPEQNHRNAQDLLKELGHRTNPEEAFDLLVALKWWSPNENLFLKRSSYPVNFPQKVSDVASSYLQTLPPDADGDRLDLTHLKVYTIDDESTEEIDDGLSIEYLEDDQVKLWIHIADPTRLVTPGDELDLEARKRSTTL